MNSLTGTHASTPTQYEAFKNLATNKVGEMVRLVFSSRTHQITASILHKDGRITAIKREDSPKEFQKINSLLLFQSYLYDAYAKVGQFINGDYSLRIAQRGRGGAPGDEGEDGDLVSSTMSLMTTGLETISNSDIRKTCVMLVGRTWAGKSMIGNLLSGVNVVGVADVDEKFKFVPINPLFPVSNDIGSCTRCPGLHSPVGKTYTFVDFPGFGDTQGPYQDLANAFFRAEVTKKTENMKFLLVVAYEDIIQRGTYLTDTIEALLNFLGCSRDEAGLNMAATSIGLIVTKVSQPKDNTEQASAAKYAEVKSKLEERQRGLSSLKAKNLLKYILEKSAWTIFSAPKENGPCGKAIVDKIEMHKLINSLKTIKRNDASIQVKVSPRYTGEVLSSIGTLTQNLKQKFASQFLRELDAHIKKTFHERGEQALRELLNHLQALSDPTATRTIAEFTAAINQICPLNPTLISEAQRHHFALEFLVDLLPTGTNKDTHTKRQWIQQLGIATEFNSRILLLTRILEPATVTVTNNTIIVRGYFPKTSQVRTTLADRSVANIKEVEIYGLHTFTIDEDLDDEKMSGVNVTIIAPTWDITRFRGIDLSGRNSTHRYPRPADDGENLGDNGAKGEPGLPGTSGGNFFGLGRTFNGLNRLTVVSNGGNGSEGQDGGRGHAGETGTNATPEIYPPHQKGVWSVIGEKDCNSNQMHTNNGTPGKKGGDGGQGGSGGEAGFAGSVELISLSDPSATIATTLRNGNAGRDGAPGEGGQGGANGNKWVGLWYHNGNEWNGWSPLKYEDCGKADDGTTPTATNSAHRIDSTRVPKANSNLHFIGFKEFLIEANNLWSLEDLDTFRHEYESNVQVKRKASVPRFIEESLRIEDIYSHSTNKLRCLPLYLSLLTRLNEYSRGTTRHSAEDVVKLQYLCGFVLSKICQLNAASAPRLVIDIRGFLGNVNRNIDELRSLERSRMIEVYKGEYEAQTKEKIQEADVFLKKLNEDIKAAHKDITVQINALIAEVRQLAAAGEASRSQLLTKQQELNDALAKKALLGGIGIAVQCIGSCFGPVGAIIGSVANAGLQIAANSSTPNAIAQGAVIAGCVAQLTLAINTQPTGNGNSQQPGCEQQQMMQLMRARDISVAAAAAAQAANRLQQELEAGENQLRQLETAVRNADEQITRLHAYETRVPGLLKTPLHSLVENADALQKKLQEGSTISRDYSRLAVKRMFEDVKRQLKSSTQGFSAGDGFITIVEQLHDAVETSMTIYDRVQDYEDRIALAKYMANLANPTMGVQDPKLNDLLLKAQFNLVLEQYSRSIAAVRQWAFPFGMEFLGDFADLEQFNNAATISDHTNLIKQRVSRLQTRVTDYYTQILANVDRAIMVKTSSSTPFYVWKNDEISKEMTSLLQGKPVILFADVRRSTENQAATKFNEVGIKLKCNGNALQRRMNTALQGYKVELYHSGQSYYRYGNDIYQISNDGGFNITYSFAKDKQGIPDDKNKVYVKMKIGDLMLSPYTYWVVQLVPVSGRGSSQLFDSFNHLKENIELHLVGAGQYVDETKTRTLQLDPDYKRLIVKQ